ncbi:MAG: hypothetical protein COB15_11700 [Flavobacteriales bacterium]|nr:MAG: hypothetical protein COB15_11700 [Flavobacteriales bacterium]
MINSSFPKIITSLVLFSLITLTITTINAQSINKKNSPSTDYFIEYFKSSEYISMITKTFGKDTAEHILKMTQYKLKRKHNFEKVNY